MQWYWQLTSLPGLLDKPSPKQNSRSRVQALQGPPRPHVRRQSFPRLHALVMGCNRHSMQGTPLLHMHGSHPP